MLNLDKNIKHITDILKIGIYLRWTSWRLSNRPWLSSIGGGACEKISIYFLSVFAYQFVHYSTIIKEKVINDAGILVKI